MIPGVPTASLGQSIVAEARTRWLLARPPALTDGELDVLARLGPDLPRWRWAEKFNVSVLEIERAEAWLRAKGEG